jgi:hypothetical protein
MPAVSACHHQQKTYTSNHGQEETKKPLDVPTELRTRLETARIELLALFRALDRLHLSPRELPQEELHELFELDADFAEALHVMDHPPPFPIDTKAMVRDTLESLDLLEETREEFLDLLPDEILPSLRQFQDDIKAGLTKQDAYHSIPGSDPQCS